MRSGEGWVRRDSRYLKVSFAVRPTQNFQTISRHGQRSKDYLAMVKPHTPPTGDNALDVDEKRN